MRPAARLRSWARATFRRDEFEHAMDDELLTHVALYEDDLRSRGVPADEARRRARAEFGALEAKKDECRQASGLRLLDEIRGDTRYALRLLRRSPAFALVALSSLALGIGANTAIFSLIDTVLLKSLPVADPDRVVFVDNSGGRSGGSNGPPYPCFEILRDHNRFLSAIAAFKPAPLKVTIDGTPEELRGQYASGIFFDLLGVRAVHGRVLRPEDDSQYGQGGPAGAVAVISHGLWIRRFGQDPGVLGKTVLVGTIPVTIVGVTPPEFFGLQVGKPIDITIPMMLTPNSLDSKMYWWFSVVARLKPDASADQARADLDALFDAYMTDLGQPRAKRDYFSGIELVPAARGLNALRRQFSEPLLIVMATVGVVLLIGCANVANLLLARARARRNEMAVRLAIGAPRGRLIRQLLTEGAVLALLGAAAGLIFARWAVTLLVGLIAGPGRDTLLDPVFDLRVLAFTGGVAALTALLFSLAPALRATRVDAARPASTGGTRPGLRLGQPLVVIQIALSVILLSGAALFVRTLQNLHGVEPGFAREGIVTLQVQSTVPPGAVRAKLPAEHRADHARLGAMWEDFIAAAGAFPGVSSAAAATMTPLTGLDRGVVIAISGQGRLPEPQRGIHINQVTSGFFDTLGIPIVSGRPFTPRDRAAAPRVAILNQTAARTYFGGENPLGRRVNLPGQRVEDEYEIVGIARDTRYENLRTPDERMIYVPIEQSIDPIGAALVSVRGPGDVTSVVPSIRALAAKSVPGGFVSRVITMDERVRASLVRERLLSMLATFFAALALALACIGLYGVMAYTVVGRTREIGIRVALGARQRSVAWMVVRETVALVVAGAALGLVGALAASRYVASQLFDVAPGDPAALGAAVVLLVAVTAAAAWVPARRASRIDPVVALRHE